MVETFFAKDPILSNRNMSQLPSVFSPLMDKGSSYTLEDWVIIERFWEGNPIKKLLGWGAT